MATTQLVGRKSTVDDPTDLTRRDYIAALKRTLQEVKGDDVPSLAAGVAFKIFLSLFPALFAAVAIFSLVTTVSELQEWLGQAQGFLPGSAIDLIRNPLQELATGDGGATGFAAVTGVLTGLWAATGAAVSLMKALSRAYDVPETRKFVRQRLVALAITVALVAALVGIVVFLVIGPQIQTAVLGEVAAPFSWLLALVRFTIALAVLVLLFAFVYWIGPNRDHPSWVWMSPGAVFGVVGWLLASGGFTLYAQTAGTYNETYGTIAGVVVLLVWLQLSMLVILVGAEFNAEVERSRAVLLAVDEGAGFAAPAATGAVIPGDQESGDAAVVQTQVTAHTTQPVEVDPTTPLAPVPAATWDPDATPDVPQRSAAGGDTPAGHAASASGRKVGVVTAAVMAGAVFLGFARKRNRG